MSAKVSKTKARSRSAVTGALGRAKSSAGKTVGYTVGTASPRNRAAAARIRVKADAKRGVDTPAWIKKLAKTA